MSNKLLYDLFIKTLYVPIFSLPWWLDAICGEDNWDVWLYKEGDNILAALPYYKEKRGDYDYITKAKLTQNNGLIIKYPNNQSSLNKVKLEERIVNSLNDFLSENKIDVYEQQFHYSFENFLPFFWNGYDVIPRVTYVMNKEIGIEGIDSCISSNYRNKIRKGERSIKSITSINKDIFYHEHEKIFLRQGLECPFSYNLWNRLFDACVNNSACNIYAAKGFNDEILSLAFVVFDTNSFYLLMGGEIPEYSSLQTFPYLVRECIKEAFLNNKDFDFEGSVIKRINHSFREYGGKPYLYYRIRKVFNPEIVMKEANNRIKNM